MSKYKVVIVKASAFECVGVKSVEAKPIGLHVVRQPVSWYL